MSQNYNGSNYGMLRHNSSTLSISNNQTLQSYNSFSNIYDHRDDAYALSRPVGRKLISSSSPFRHLFNPFLMIRSLFPSIQSLLNPTCRVLALGSPSNAICTARKRLTGTFFGAKKGKVSFAVQQTPKSQPITIIELPTSTSQLMKEMASGVVRILLECERSGNCTTVKIWDEPKWSVTCNGRKLLGYATSRDCMASDIHVLSTIQSMSVGAGVIPMSVTDDQTAKNSTQSGIMYMRARFDRVSGSKDSEAFYMINPDRARGVNKHAISEGPELSIFMLRV